MFRIYGIIAVVGVVGAVLLGAYWEYKDMQQRIATLRENNAKLELVAAENARTVSELEKFNSKMITENATLQQNLQKAETYSDELLEKLRKHDLSKLSLQKPGLVERRVNNATKEVFTDIESLTSISTD
ncbi:MAG: hypothetical protein CBB97_22560 [Candidatus Endolissoclinum sp. TMED37]|nr:MAG: hypothetical protein CBB97_22560 [Candidatus Endolissoclinum sp. TMED37]